MFFDGKLKEFAGRFCDALFAEANTLEGRMAGATDVVSERLKTISATLRVLGKVLRNVVDGE